MSSPWMPLYVADYLADTRRLSMAEHGAYMLLIMEYWRNGGLPDDERRLARIVGATPDEWLQVRDNVAELFQPGWRHKRIDAELAKSRDKSEAAKASASRRWESKGNANAHANAHANAMPTQCEGNANAMLSQSQSYISPSLRSGDTRAGRASASEAKQAAQEFERFWQVWPNKIGKPAAAKAYFKVWRETEAIIAGVNRYMRDKPADRPWLNPSTFLNQRRWEDDPAPVANARGSPAREETSGVAKLLAEAYGIDRRNGTQAAGDFTDIRSLPVTHVGVGTADYGDDGGIFGGLRRPDG